jgi:hypothetical protein
MYICMYVYIPGTPCYEGSVQNLLENACREAEIYKDSQVVSYDMCLSLILIVYTSRTTESSPWLLICNRVLVQTSSTVLQKSV